MGGRHSTPNNPDDEADVRTLGAGGVALDHSPRPALPPRADRTQEAAEAVGGVSSAPGTSRRLSGGSTASSSDGAAVAKHRPHRASAAATAHRRLVLDMLAASGVGGRTGSYRTPSSNDSTPEDSPLNRTLLTSSSLPLHIFALRDIRCPVCHKMIPADDVECHLVMCLTKPRITYNEDVLAEDKEECIICLEELRQGDVIARLPCLCVYHKSCIDQWFKVNRSCPEHPDG